MQIVRNKKSDLSISARRLIIKFLYCYIVRGPTVIKLPTPMFFVSGRLIVGRFVDENRSDRQRRRTPSRRVSRSDLWVRRTQKVQAENRIVIIYNILFLRVSVCRAAQGNSVVTMFIT